MRRDILIDEIPEPQVRRMAKILGPSSAPHLALDWASVAGEQCYYFRSQRGHLIVVRDSLLKGVSELKNVELEKHFKPIPESQYCSCIHCGKTRIKNQGLAKLAHLAKCTRSGAGHRPQQ